jgi:hypothetical protein
MLPLNLSLVTAYTPDADLYSSPFLDYLTNTVYVGDDGGDLYAFTGVFGGTLAYAGGNFPVAVSSYALSSPVVDAGGTGDIIFGDGYGYLYNYTSAGVSAATKLTIGNTTNAGGIRDAPIVDSTNSVGYVVAGCNTTPGDSQLTQFSFSGSALTSKATASLTTDNCTSPYYAMYDPALDNAYYTAGINSGHVLTCQTSNSNSFHLKQFAFSSGTMSTSASPNYNPSTSGTDGACSPLTEFYGDDVADTVTAVAQSGTTVTVTVANTFVIGQAVTVSGVTAGSGACSATVAAAIDGEQTPTGSSTSQITFTSAVSATFSSGTCTLTSPKATGPTVDYLFFAVTSPEAYTFTLPLPGSPSPKATNTTSVTGGTSGIIVDNDSSAGQASSLYFGTLATSSACGTTVYCAVKLTQSGLN